MFDRRQPPHVRAWQRILNDAIPIGAESYKRHQPIPVLVRVVWEDDGEEWLDGEATRWDADHVYVELWRGRVPDPRQMTTGVWVRPADVRRHAQSPADSNRSDR